MGCDIHLFHEKKVYPYNDHEKLRGVWVSLDPWYERDDFQDDREIYKPLEVPYGKALYRDRNYELFFVLAGVRGDSDNFSPISPPKGLPIDVSRLVKKAAHVLGSDGHSHSYLTLLELKDYDWSRTSYCERFIEDVIPELETKASDNSLSYSEIRIVFWFDN